MRATDLAETCQYGRNVARKTGCISGPIWTLIVGYVMQNYGFTRAFYIAAATYIAGMILLLFVKEEPKSKSPA